MAKKLSGEVRGLKELEQKLGRLAAMAEDPKVLGEALMQGGLIIERSTKENITSQGLVDTGKMRASVEAFLESFNVVVVIVRAAYAIFHEFGTRYLPARPFLRPAVDTNAGKVLKAISAYLKEEISMVAKK